MIDKNKRGKTENTHSLFSFLLLHQEGFCIILASHPYIEKKLRELKL